MPGPGKKKGKRDPGKGNFTTNKGSKAKGSVKGGDVFGGISVKKKKKQPTERSYIRKEGKGRTGEIQ